MFWTLPPPLTMVAVIWAPAVTSERTVWPITADGSP
jgi:hypothetical protein